MNEAKPYPQLLGLVELDQVGTVLYLDLEKSIAGSGVQGRGYFSEVAPFKKVEAFRKLSRTFSRGFNQVNGVIFTCDLDGLTVPVRVLFAQILERSDGQYSEKVLFRIRDCQATAEIIV